MTDRLIRVHPVGIPGASVYFGEGEPAPAIGRIGDTYINGLNGEGFTKRADGWDQNFGPFLQPQINAVLGALATLTPLLPSAADFPAIADALPGIGVVAGSVSSINAAAGNATNINAVANNAANINAVAGNAANINAVAGEIDAVAEVADNMEAVLLAASQSIDGGSPTSVYTLTQTVDGGLVDG